MRPGSVIYLPPGYWHQVVPVEEDSFSVDIRIANLAQCKWICEAVFVSLLAKFYGQSDRLLAVNNEDMGQGFSASLRPQVQHIQQNLEGILAECKPLRCIPFEALHTDGLSKGASLDFLRESNFLAPPLDSGASVGLNRLVAMSLKRRDDEVLLVQLHSVSSLSTMEYIRFTVLCLIDVLDAMQLLMGHAKVPIGVLYRKSPGDELRTLLRALVHANVLYVEGAVPGAPEPKKRPGRRPEPKSLKRQKKKVSPGT